MIASSDVVVEPPPCEEIDRIQLVDAGDVRIAGADERVASVGPS